MIQIPLPRTITGSSKTPKLQQHLINLIYAQGALLSRPACIRVKGVNGTPRGQFKWDGVQYSVFGNKLYSGTDLTEVGEINGTGKISFAVGYNAVAIATGNSNYTFNGTLTAISDPDLPACRDVTRVDGQFIWTPLDGDALLFSEVDDAGNIDSLSFFDAETLPDKNRITVNIRNTLVVCGEDSIEPFRNVGTVSNPFVRVGNAIISVGYVGGVIETRDSFLFLGKDKDGGYAIYAYSAGSAAPISTDPINEMLNNDYTLEQLQTVEGQRFNWGGVDCYVFSLPDKDLIFSGGETANWNYLVSGTEDPHVIEPWGYRNAFHFNDTWYVQRSDGLYKLTDDDADTFGNFGRGIQTYIRAGDDRPLLLAYLEMSIYHPITTGSVGVSVSKDGVLWSDIYYRNTGVNFDNRLRWQPSGGFGLYEGYVGLFFYTTDNVRFSVDNIVAYG